MRRAAIAVLAVLAASSCSSSHAKVARRATTTTATSSTTTSTLPPTTTTAPDLCAVPPRAVPDPKRPRYALTLDVQPAAQKVVGDLSVKFTPDIDTDRLVFRVWANGPRLTPHGGHEEVSGVTVDGKPASTTQPDPTTLLVQHAVAAAQTATVALHFDLTLPGADNDRIAQIGDSIRLGSFFPILAWEPGRGWATDPAVDAFAEASTAPTADFDVTVTTPPGLDVLASGDPDASGRHWTASARRDVALSIGHFRLSSVDRDGVHITVGVATELADDPAAYARKLAEKLDLFTRFFGPYPWSTYTMAVTPALSGGIEYPSHVMQGPNTIGRTTTHELGHQWFYGLVGNDQGRDPWLDEGLATYAEARGENTLTEFTTEAIPADARGHVADNMTYWSAHQPSYYRGVYVQGARAMAGLGPVDRVDCALRIYLAQNAYRIARDRDLIAAAAQVFADAPAKLAALGITSSP